MTTPLSVFMKMSIVRKRPLPADTEHGDSKKAERPLSSGRVSRPAKRRKTEDTSDTNKQNVIADTKPSVAAVKMKRQAWSSVAIDAFFEGLYQHGKNFHRILKHMQGKQKKLNDPVIANLTRNQVRFFYYRTWRKVESLLNESSDSKKSKTVEVPGTSPHTSDGTRAMFEEDTIDLSMEEPDANEPSPQRLAVDSVAFSEVYNPTGELELENKAKEHIEASSVASITDKVEARVKDTVVVNGVRQHIDLVALICYNKLKKKCSGDHNLGKKLSELVYHGTTTIPGRKRKKVQIKIPNCVALRPATLKTHEETAAAAEEPATAVQPPEAPAESLSEPEPCSPNEDHSDVPAQIAVELRPRTTATWLYVQGLAQNPRVRVTVCGSKPLSHVVQFLCQKWQLQKGPEPSSINFYHNYSCWRSPSGISSPVLGSVDGQSGDQEDTLTANQCPEVSPSVGTVKSSQSGSTGGSKQVSAGDVGKHDGAEDSNENPLGGRKTKKCGNDILAAEKVADPQSSCKQHSGTNKTLHKQSENQNGADTVPTSFASADGEKEGISCVTANSSDGLSPIRCLNVHMSCSVRDILHKFYTPSCLQLLYDVPIKNVEEEPIGTVLKLVEYMRRTELTSTPMKSPSSKGIAHHSPKVKQYMRSLAQKQSPRKSPLAKYWRLKARSSSSVHTSAKRALNASFDNTDNAKVEDIPKRRPLRDTVKSSNSNTAAAFARIELQNVFSSASTSPRSSISLKSLEPPPAQPTITQKSIPAILPTPSSQSPPVSLHTPLPVQTNPASTVVAQIVPSPAPTKSSSHVLVTSHEIPATVTTPVSTKPVSMVTTLKPFSKPRRPKKSLNAMGVPQRQLIPRPLIYLPNAIAGQTSKDKKEMLPPTNSTGSVTVSPSNQATPLSNPTAKQEAATTTLINHQLLALLQTVLLQQQNNNQQPGQQQKQQSSPPTTQPSPSLSRATDKLNTKTNASSSTASMPSLTPSALSGQPLHLGKETVDVGRAADSDSDAELQSAIFSNLLAEHMPNYNIGVSPSKLQLFHTSSDTVNDLLRGLSTTQAVDSIERLSKETEAVLPTFAKALEASISAENVNEDVPVNACQFGEQPSDFAPPATDNGSGDGTEVETAQNLDHDDFGLPQDNDRLLPPSETSNNESLSDFLGNFTDSNLSQRIEQIDFSDVFSQLKDVLKTPDKLREDGLQPHIRDAGASIGGLLDILGTPDRSKAFVKDNTTNTAAAVLDPTYKSLMDETSVDYIQKFKELASRMNSEMS